MHKSKDLSKSVIELNDTDQTVIHEEIKEINKKAIKKSSKIGKLSDQTQLPKINTVVTNKNITPTSNIAAEERKSSNVELDLPKLIVETNSYLDIFQLENLGLLKLNDYNKFKETKDLVDVNFLDLSGLERLTDFSVFKICQLIRTNPNVNSLKFNKFKLNACKNISIWSLSYLAKSSNSNLLDLFNLENNTTEALPLAKRVSSCELISKDMIVSLQHSPDNHKDIKLADTSKIVIINEDTLLPCIAKRLVPTTKTDNRLFTYAKLNYLDKILNIYDCSESFSHLVLTERNLIVLTFNIEKIDAENYERINKSLMRRLLMLASKNILPISVMILGLGGSHLNDEVIKKVADNLNDSVLSLQKDLEASLATQMDKNNEFQVQIQVSHQLNLKEQLEFFKSILNFSVLDPSANTDSLSSQINQTTSEDKLAFKTELLKQNQKLTVQAQKAIELLTRQNILELKNFNEPNNQIQSSAEAFNLLFGISGGWSEFRSRLNFDTIDKLKMFDFNSIPAKTIQTLAKIVDSDEFKMTTTNCYSQASQGISRWIQSVYNINLTTKKLNDLDKYGPGTSYKTLSEYLVKNAFYNFCWPAYYDDQQLTKSDKTNSVVVDQEKLNRLIGEKFLPMSDYLGKYGELISGNGYKNLCENFALAESARGNFFLCGYKRNFLVTDVAWFASVIQTLHESKTTGQRGELSSFVKDSVPIWKEEHFRKIILKDLSPENANIIVRRLEKLTIFKIQSEFILPLFLLSNTSPKDLKKYWPSNWSGYEYSIKFDLVTPLNSQCFNQIISSFFDPIRTVTLWKNGLIKRDGGCDVLVINNPNESYLQLATRIIDYNKQLNLKSSTAHTQFAKFIYMQYYLFIKLILNKHSITYKTDPAGLSKHLADLRETKDGDIDMGDLNNLVAVCDYEYFLVYFLHEHQFSSTDKTCQCTMNMATYNSLITSFKHLYPDQFNVSQQSTVVNSKRLNKIKLKRIDSFYDSYYGNTSFQSAFAMHPCKFPEFQFRLIDFSLKDKCKLNIILEIRRANATPENELKLIIDLSRNLYYTENFVEPLDILTDLITDFKHVETKEQLEDAQATSKSSMHSVFTSGDAIRVKYTWVDEKNSKVLVFINMKRVLKFNISSVLSVYPSVDMQVKSEIEKQPAVYLSNLYRVINCIQLNEVRSSSRMLNYLKGSKLEKLVRAGLEKEDEYVVSVNVSCQDQSRVYMDPHTHIRSINKAFGSKGITYLKKQIKIYRRGLLIIPSNLPAHLIEMPNLLFSPDTNNPLTIILPCINLQEPIADEIVYVHLIDTPAIPFTLEQLDKLALTSILVTSYLISNAHNSILIPSYKTIQFAQTISNPDETIRNYSRNLFNLLCLSLTDDDLKTKITDGDKKKGQIAVQEYLNSKISSDNLLSKFTGPVCSFCTDAAKNLDSPDNKYTQCCMTIALTSKSSDSTTIPLIKLDENFSQRFSNLRMFRCHLDTDQFTENFFKPFKSLVRLELVNSRFKKLPASLKKLTKLEWLEISTVDLHYSSLVDSLTELNSLSKLKLENLKCDASSTSVIKVPASLTYLNLTNFQQNFIPIDLTESNLKTLKCRGVPLVSMAKNEQMSLAKATELYISFLTAEQIEDVFELIQSDLTQYLNARDIVKFNAFIWKRFPRLGDNVDVNQSGIPTSLFSITSLTELDLSYQAIRFIPDAISTLVNLDRLNLDSCLFLASISAKLGSLPLTYLNINRCLSLKTPPPEIQRRGFTAVLAYLKGLSAGSVACKRTKLMLVGLGEAGKTSLMNTLRRGCVNEDETSKNNNAIEEKTFLTDGIDIKEWQIQLPDSTNLTYSMWDFAGQSVYYNTHQFFFSQRAIYILVWNVRLGSEYAGLVFWLSSISCHAPGSPIFVVGTHIDQVSKYFLNQKSLKMRFPQIEGFFFVSNSTKKGIDLLAKRLVEVTLQQKYIGEKTPETWFNFEAAIKKMSRYKALISFDELVKLAESCSLFDVQEILQATRFLNDLGSVQYFESTGLKDYIVINPQWIVDAMACLVSVKESCIVDGQLKHSEINVLWKNYAESLLPWMLNLTEEFDLTFPVEGKELSIVPCLLSDEEPVYEWPELSSRQKTRIKEFQVLYTFSYIPAGLFNRMQVRLYNYAETTIWKSGSILRKNSHLALIKQLDDTIIQVKVRGSKPENIVFIIHEVLNTLISETYFGIKFDYSFPCPECIEGRTSDPCLFSGTLLNRALDHKAPFLQCNKYFHVISIQDMLAVMPINGNTPFDTDLGNSLRDLKFLKRHLKYDIGFWYFHKDVEGPVNPVDVINSVKNIGDYLVWHPEDPFNQRIDQITAAFKDSRLVVLCVSDGFVNDEKCIQVFDLVTKILRSKYLLVEFGSSHKWLEAASMVQVCGDLRIIMQNPKRTKSKLEELQINIERQISEIKIDPKANEAPVDVFISYCWKNSKQAIDMGSAGTELGLGWLDPRTLVDFFKEHGINAWLDVESIQGNSLFSEITKGLNKAKIVVVCLSDEYVESVNCSLEFKFAHVSLRLPMVKAIVGRGNEWRKNEVAFMAGGYEEINCQYEIKEERQLDKLLKCVQRLLNEAKIKELKQQKKSMATNEMNLDIDDAHSIATSMQELYELTQRKFLTQITQASDSMMNKKQYPRLFCLELIEIHKFEALEKLKSEKNGQISESQNEKILEQTKLAINRLSGRYLKENNTQFIPKFIPCFHAVCEAEEGWHLSETFMDLKNVYISKDTKFCPYLSRISHILKNGSVSNSMKLYMCDRGEKLLNNIDEVALTDDIDFTTSYQNVRNYCIEKFEKGESYNIDAFKNTDELTGTMGLFKCQLKNHKVLWLCRSHVEKMGAKVINDSVKVAEASMMMDINDPGCLIVECIENLNMDHFGLIKIKN